MQQTTFEEQLAELRKPLDPALVMKVKKGGTFSYVPSWHVIEELNRIFGPAKWTQRTLKLTQKGYKRPKKDDEGKEKIGFAVACTAEVELVVTFADGSVVTRADVGAGSHVVYNGDWGEASEKAVKEAATDGMKRCARTFGNTFGLSLYDKDNPLHKGNEDSHGEEPEPPAPSEPPKVNKSADE